jgi:multidrug efflux system membrane fusion protein
MRRGFTTSRTLRAAALACGLSIAAAGAWIWLHAANAQSAAQATAPSGPPAVPVTVEPAQRRDVPIILRNIGAVQAFQSVLVRARVDGTLDQVFFQEGQEVKPGDKLAQIDPRPYQAVLDQVLAKRAQDLADMANAQRDLARYQSLAQRDFASHQQVDTQQALVAHSVAALSQDEAAIAAARLNLDFTTIRAPIEGRTGLRMVDAGNLVHANDTAGLVMITQIHPIAVVFTLPQTNLPGIQAAMAKGTLPVYAYDDDGALLATGELMTIDNMIDQTTGTIKLKAKFANLDNRLWPGQFITAGLRVGTQTNVIAVSSIAVQHGPNGLFVYVVNPNSTAAMRPVTVSQDDGKFAVIASGLDDNVQVVTTGQSRLQDGTRVAATVAKANT